MNKTDKNKNPIAKATLRAWIMGLIMLVSFIVFQIAINSPANYNHLTKQTNITYLGFIAMMTTGFAFSVAAFLFLNFFKGMTKAIYKSYIGLAIMYPLTYFVYLVLGVNLDNVWKLVGIILLTILILLQSFIAGRTVRNSIISAALIIPSIAINMVAINIFFFAWKMV